MIWMRLLPGVLKELIKHVPTVLFQVVDWNKLLTELPILSRRIMQKEGYDQIFEQQRTLLNPFNIILSRDQLNGPYLPHKWSAEKCLYLYFAQLYSPHGLFLDLRAQHFEARQPEYKWHPSGLWTCFQDHFRLGLLDVYEGFYLDKEDLYFEGLRKIGLLSEDWTDEDKEKLGNLFKAQFGSAKTTEMAFDLEHFKTSIFKTSDFMLKKKVKISNDFLYLGIYLVTLYAHLEQSGEKLPVRDIYLKVREHFATSKIQL